MKIVAVIAGHADTVEEAEKYEAMVLNDCLTRDEAPLLLTAMYDTLAGHQNAQVRDQAALYWAEQSRYFVIYDDYALDARRQYMIDEARDMGHDIEFRKVPDWIVARAVNPKPDYLPKGMDILFHISPYGTTNTVPFGVRLVEGFGVKILRSFGNPVSMKLPAISRGMSSSTVRLDIPSYVARRSDGLWMVYSEADFERRFGAFYRCKVRVAGGL